MKRGSLLFLVCLASCHVGLGFFPPPFPPPPPPPKLPGMRFPPFIIPPPPPPPILPSEVFGSDQKCSKSSHGSDHVNLDFTDSTCKVIKSSVENSAPGVYAAYIKSGHLGKNGICKIMDSATYDEHKVIGIFTDGRNNGAIHQPSNATNAHLYIICYTGTEFASVEFDFILVTTIKDTKVEQLGNNVISNPNWEHAIDYDPKKFQEWRLEQKFKQISIQIQPIAINIASTDVLLIFSDDRMSPTQVLRDQQTVNVVGGSITIQFITGAAKSSSDILGFQIAVNPFIGMCGETVPITPTSSPISIENHPQCPSFVFSMLGNDYPFAIYVDASENINDIACKVYDNFESGTEIGKIDHKHQEMVVTPGTTAFVMCKILDPATAIKSFDVYAVPFERTCGHDVDLTAPDFTSSVAPPSIDGVVDDGYYCEWNVYSPMQSQQSIRSQIDSLTLTSQDMLLISGEDNAVFKTNVMNEPLHFETLQYSQPLKIQFVSDHVTDLPESEFQINLRSRCSKFCTYTDNSQSLVRISWFGVIGDVTVLQQSNEAIEYGLNPEQTCFPGLEVNSFYTFDLNPRDKTIHRIHNSLVETMTLPGRSDPPTVVSITTESVKLRWPPYTEGNVPIEMYEIRWFSEFDGSKMIYSTLDGELKNLKTNVEYEATVAAANEAGTGIHSEPVTFVTLPAARPPQLLDCPSTQSLLFNVSQPASDGTVRPPYYKMKICWCTKQSDIQSEIVEGDIFQINNLLPNTKYLVFLKFYYDDGLVVKTPRKAFNTRPTAMTQPQIDNETLTSISLSWQPYTQGNARIQGYVVSWVIDSLFVSSTSAVVKGLEGNTNYHFTVAAKNKDCVGTPSATLIATTEHKGAENFSILGCNETDIQFGWNSPVGNARAVVMYAFCLIGFGCGSIANTETTTTFGLPQPGFQYAFKLETHFNDSTVFITDAIIGFTAPIYTSLPTIDAVTATSFSASWPPPISNHNLTEYALLVNGNLTAFSSKTMMIVVNLSPGSNYSVSVVAKIDGKESEGPTAIATTASIPSPGNFLALEVVENAAVLSWSGSPSPVVTGYIIRRNGGIITDVGNVTVYRLLHLPSNTDTRLDIAAYVANNPLKTGEFSSSIIVCTDPEPYLINQTEQGSTSTTIEISLTNQNDGSKRAVVHHTAYINNSSLGVISIFGNFSGLNPSTSYTIFITTLYNDSLEMDSETIVAQTVPDKPMEPTVIEKFTNTLLVMANKPPGGNEIGEVEFLIDGVTYETTHYVGPVTIITLHSLTGNTEYMVSVRFCNFKCGEASDSVLASTLPIPVQTSLPENATNNMVTVSWDIPPQGGDVQQVQGYRVFVYNVLGAEQSHRTATFTMPPNTRLLYEIHTVYTVDTVQSRQFFAITKPSKILGSFVVSDETQMSILVTFTKPPGGDEIDGYKFCYTSTTSNGTFNHTSSDTMALITGLTPNTNYTVVVKAYNQAGEGIESQPFQATTAPGPPQNLFVKSRTSTTVTVDWDVPIGDVETPLGYSVQLLNEFGIPIRDAFEVAETEILLSFLTPMKLYLISVKAVYSFGEVASNLFCIVAGAPAPIIQIEPKELSSLRVKWEPISGQNPCCAASIMSISVSNSRTNITDVEIPVDPHDPDREYKHTFNLEPNEVYLIQARWYVEEAGLGNVTEVEAITYPKSICPENIHLVSTTSTSIEIEWDPSTVGDLDILGYKVVWSPYSTHSEFIETSATTATIYDLQPDQEYRFAVLTKNSLGYSHPAEHVTFATKTSFVPSPYISTSEPPTTTTITINWFTEPSCAPVIQYKLRYWQTSGNQTHMDMFAITHVQPYMMVTVEDLLPNTVYDFSVVAFNKGGQGNWSDPVSACTLPNQVALPSVEFQVIENSVIVDWVPPVIGGGAEILKYKVSWHSVDHSGSMIVIINGVNHTATITGLEPATLYEITVQAMNAHGFSEMSERVYITTGSGIICNNFITIKLSPDDISEKINPLPGDEIVVSHTVDKTSDTHTLKPQCKATPVIGEPLTFYFNITDCESRTGHPLDHLGIEDESVTSYSYKVQVARMYDMSILVQRFPTTYLFTFTCEYNNTMTISSPEIKTFVKKTLMSMESQRGQIELEFLLFTSRNFDTPLTGNPPSIFAFKSIFAQLQLLVDSDLLYLQTQKCWATPSDSPVDARQYPIIDHGEAVHMATDPINSTYVFQNYQPRVTAFKFTAFVWTNLADHNQSIFVHCNVELCDVGLGHSCKIMNRKKRSFTSSEVKTISYGPITIKPEKTDDPCKQDNGGCEHKCSVVKKKIVCHCKTGWMLNRDGKTCRRRLTDQVHEIIEERMNVEKKVVIGFVLCLVLMTMWLNWTK